MPEYKFDSKWSREIAVEGFTMVPNLLIENMARLGMKPNEIAVLLCILKHAWTKDDPYPSHETICKYSGLSESQIKRIIIQLENKKLLVRVKRGKRASNGYNLVQLRNELQHMAKEKQKYYEKKAARYASIQPQNDADTDP